MGSNAKVSIVVLLLVAACSGANETELFGPTKQGGSGATPIGGSSGDDGASSSSSSGGSSSDGTSSSSSSTSSSSSSSSSGGDTGKDAGAAPPPPPAPACTAEIEPNNEADRATLFTSCIEGTLKKSDIDYAEIVAPAQTTKLSIAHEETGGKVSYRVFINGLPFPAFTGDAPEYIPAVTSATYRIQMQPSGTGSGTRTYRLAVTFE